MATYTFNINITVNVPDGATPFRRVVTALKSIRRRLVRTRSIMIDGQFSHREHMSAQMQREIDLRRWERIRR